MNTCRTTTRMLLLSGLFVSGLSMSGIALADHHEGGTGKEEMHHHGGMHGDMKGGMGPGPMFDRFDTDKDSRISKDEMRTGTDKVFAEADTNKDGFVSREEMTAYHQAMHEKMHGAMRDKMQQRWKAADKDGDGGLSKAEVDAAKMTHLSRDFDKMDKNKDGKLTPDEVRAMMPERQPR